MERELTEQDRARAAENIERIRRATEAVRRYSEKVLDIRTRTLDKQALVEEMEKLVEAEEDPGQTMLDIKFLLETTELVLMSMAVTVIGKAFSPKKKATVPPPPSPEGGLTS